MLEYMRGLNSKIRRATPQEAPSAEQSTELKSTQFDSINAAAIAQANIYLSILEQNKLLKIKLGRMPRGLTPTTITEKEALKRYVTEELMKQFPEPESSGLSIEQIAATACENAIAAYIKKAAKEKATKYVLETAFFKQTEHNPSTESQGIHDYFHGETLTSVDSIGLFAEQKHFYNGDQSEGNRFIKDPQL